MKKYKLICLAIVLTLWSSVSASAYFQDSADHKYAEAIEFVQSREIVHGYPDGTFQPDNLINRAELLKVVLESNLPSNTIESHVGENCFPDVPNNAWYTKYVCAGKAEGIINGHSDNSFRPEQAINFVEALKILQLAYGYNYDNSSSPWYKNSVNQASSKNIIPLDISFFDSKISRGQMAEMLTRLIQEQEGSLDEYLGTKKDFRVTFDTIKDNLLVESDWQYYNEEQNDLLSRKSLVEVKKIKDSCSPLLVQGSSENKIDIVFVAEGGISFDDYKTYIEGFLSENNDGANLLNTNKFGNSLKQFNFYSIWKEDNYWYGPNEEYIYYKDQINEVQEVCPNIRTAFDAYSAITPKLSEDDYSFGTGGEYGIEKCLSEENSLGEGCIAYSTIKVSNSTTTNYTNIIHEWQHMFNVSHEDMEESVQHQIEVACEKIAQGSSITFEECIN